MLRSSFLFSSYKYMLVEREGFHFRILSAKITKRENYEGSSKIVILSFPQNSKWMGGAFAFDLFHVSYWDIKPYLLGLVGDSRVAA